jgi:hypothetical protein
MIGVLGLIGHKNRKNNFIILFFYLTLKFTSEWIARTVGSCAREGFARCTLRDRGNFGYHRKWSPAESFTFQNTCRGEPK